MIQNPLVYPTKAMRITQGYDDNYTHLDHWQNAKSYRDYPWDEGCASDSNNVRDSMYCPCDEMIVKYRYIPANTSTTATTFWLESTEKVTFANGEYDYVSLLVAHPIELDIPAKNTKFKRGQLISYEGRTGNATGNHFHFAVGKGKLKVISGQSYPWAKNENNSWVLTTTNGALKPEEAFYIDPNFTTSILSHKNYNWIVLPDQPTYTITWSGQTYSPIPIISKNRPLNYSSLGYVGSIKAPFDLTYQKASDFAELAAFSSYPALIGKYSEEDSNKIEFSREIGKAWVGSATELFDLNISKDDTMYIYSNNSSTVSNIRTWLNLIK